MEAKEILAAHSTLHLIFHRNKNQHGNTKWWKWLSILKRVTLSLARSLDQRPYGGNDPTLGSQRKYLAMHVVPRCYVEFSTVVADAQFSTLGTVLLATLARLVKVTGTDRDLKKLSQTTKGSKPAASPSFQVSKTEDIGEPIRRNDDIPTLTKTPVSTKSVAHSENTAQNGMDPEAEATEKKKRRTNAIDDLFAGVL